MSGARDRLAAGYYNTGDWSAGSNPGGLGGDGHRIAMVPPRAPSVAAGPIMLADIATVGQEVADAAVAAETAAEAALALAGTAITGTSASSLTIGMDPVSLITQAGKAWVAGMRLRLGRTAAPNVDFMDVQVGSYDAGTGALTGTVTAVGGSGTHASWSLRALSVASQAQTDARTATDVAVAPAHLATGAELYGGSLTAAATLILPAVGTDFDVTGTTTIYAVSSRTRGRTIRLNIVDGLTVAHSATLRTPDAIDMTVEAGGSLTLRALTVGWEIVAQKVRRATTGAHGLARLATQAVLDARTNSTDAVTAALLAHGVGLTGTSVTAGGTLTLPAVGDDFAVTGSGATITGISARTPPGRVVRLKFAGANTLVHSAALSLFTSTNIATAAGDIVEWKSTSAGWEMVGYERADGSTLFPSSRVTISTATANNWTSIEFTSGIDAAFSRYLVEFDNITVASAVGRLQLRLQVSGSWQTSNYKFFCSFGTSASSSVSGFADTAGTRISFSAGNSPASTAGYGVSGSVLLLTPANTSVFKKVKTEIEYMDSAGELVVGTGGGSWVGGTGAVTGIQLYMESGNIFTGTAKLIGLR